MSLKKQQRNCSNTEQRSADVHISASVSASLHPHHCLANSRTLHLDFQDFPQQKPFFRTFQVWVQCFDTVSWAAGRASKWWGAGEVICLERRADMHMARLIPLPHTVSCCSKIRIGFTFLVPAHPGSPGQRAVKWVCRCVFQVLEILQAQFQEAREPWKKRSAEDKKLSSGSVAAVNLSEHGENGDAYRLSKLAGGVRSVQRRNVNESTAASTDCHRRVVDEVAQIPECRQHSHVCCNTTTAYNLKAD